MGRGNFEVKKARRKHFGKMSYRWGRLYRKINKGPPPLEKRRK